MTSVERNIPVVTCPRCAWAKGGLSLMATPMLVDAFLHQAFVEHLLATHRLTPAELVAPKPVGEAAPEVESTERRSA